MFKRKFAFTICSNNYLSQARVLYESFKKYNSDYTFVVGLCDKKNKLVDYNVFKDALVIEVEDLNIDGFENMSIDYDIIELNTSIKPFLFNYLFRRFQADFICYIDPDICYYKDNSSVENEMINTKTDILLTPHICTPIPLDGLKPHENIFLNYGIYNLGFLALMNSSETFRFLDWWSERMLVCCKDKVEEGLFVDQLFINYVPVFFKNVLISRNLGLNFAYWNFHERVLTIVDDNYKVNNDTDLIFFHFSNYKYQNRDVITPYFNRFEMKDVPLIDKLYQDYFEKLIGNNIEFLSQMPCYFAEKRNEYLKQQRLEELAKESIKKKIKRKIKKYMPAKINKYIEGYSKL